MLGISLRTFCRVTITGETVVQKKKFVFLNGKQGNSQILPCLQCGKTLLVCYEKHINNFLPHRNLMSSPCGFLISRRIPLIEMSIH